MTEGEIPDVSSDNIKIDLDDLIKLSKLKSQKQSKQVQEDKYKIPIDNNGNIKFDELNDIHKLKLYIDNSVKFLIESEEFERYLYKLIQLLKENSIEENEPLTLGKLKNIYRQRLINKGDLAAEIVEAKIKLKQLIKEKECQQSQLKGKESDKLDSK